MGLWDALRGAFGRAEEPSPALPPASTYKVGRVLEKVSPKELVLVDPGEPFYLVGRVEALPTPEELLVAVTGGALRLGYEEPLAEDISAGDLVEADRDGLSRYLPGRVVGRKGEELKILFDDGVELALPAERTRVVRIHPDVPRARVLPADVSAGGRVFAPWGFDPFWYSATVAAVRGVEARIHFDNGAQAWIAKDSLSEDDIAAGELILANRGGVGAFYHATVADRRGERLRVRYRDGLEEWLPVGRVRVLFREPSELSPLTTHPG
jgi:hypothetical protein